MYIIYILRSIYICRSVEQSCFVFQSHNSRPDANKNRSGQGTERYYTAIPQGSSAHEKPKTAVLHDGKYALKTQKERVCVATER